MKQASTLGNSFTDLIHKFSLVLLFSNLAQANDSDMDMVLGVARDQETQKVLYYEQHRYFGGDDLSQQRHEVSYTSPQGDVIAQKTLDYSNSASAPSFKQENFLYREIIEVNNDGADVLAYYQVADKPKRIQVLVNSESLVVDAGFDKMVRKYWQSLISGEKRRFDFYLPTRLKTAPLQIEQRNCAREDRVCFRIVPASGFVRLLVKPLYLEYHPDTRRLLRFSGRSNVADEKGHYPWVDIEYRLSGLPLDNL